MLSHKLDKIALNIKARGIVLNRSIYRSDSFPQLLERTFIIHVSLTMNLIKFKLNEFDFFTSGFHKLNKYVSIYLLSLLGVIWQWKLPVCVIDIWCRNSRENFINGKILFGGNRETICFTVPRSWLTDDTLPCGKPSISSESCVIDSMQLRYRWNSVILSKPPCWQCLVSYDQLEG